MARSAVQLYSPSPARARKTSSSRLRNGCSKGPVACHPEVLFLNLAGREQPELQSDPLNAGMCQNLRLRYRDEEESQCSNCGCAVVGFRIAGWRASLGCGGVRRQQDGRAERGDYQG